MKRGDLFAIGEKRKANLLCEFLSEKDGAIEGNVINGAWDFTLKNGELLVHYTQRTFPAQIVWQGVLPPRGVGDYNGAIAWIDDQLRGFAITRWCRQRFFAVRERIDKVWRACIAAKKAFTKVYRSEFRVDDADDLIPF